MIKKETYSFVLLLVAIICFACSRPTSRQDQQMQQHEQPQQADQAPDPANTTAAIATDTLPPAGNWNLSEPAQPDFGMKQVKLMSKSIYDTVSVNIDPDMPEDTIERSFKELRYFSDGATKYAVAVAENRGPFYGASYGWCDLFIFRKENDQWTMTDFMLQAGGGGMYGNPGSFSKLLRSGDNSVAIVLEGGQEHMGGNYSHSLINLENGKLKRLCNISTLHNYGSGAGDDFVYTECDSNKYYFIRNGKAIYDLKIEKYNCLNESDKKTDEVLIPYSRGYKIPERFNFSS